MLVITAIMVTMARKIHDDDADKSKPKEKFTNSQKKLRKKMDEYVEALKYAEGKIFRPGTTGKGRGTIFIQLKEAGAISQLGGAIALGHPLGCSGAKLSVQLFEEMKNRKLKYGMVTMCVGTGQGAAGIFEKL